MASQQRLIEKKLPGRLIRNGYLIVFTCLVLVVLTLVFIRFKETVRGDVVITGKMVPYDVITAKPGRLILLKNEEEQVGPDEPVAYLESEAVYEDILSLQRTLNSVPLPALPESAIISDEGKSYIFIEQHEHREEPDDYDEKQYRKVLVRTGVTENGFTEVYPVESLDSDAKIVLSGAYYLMAEMNKGDADHDH